MSNKKAYELVVTTQGPTYPPSEIMDKDGNFVVIGLLNLKDENGVLNQKWGSAIVCRDSAVPKFGENLPYNIVEMIDINALKSSQDRVLYTLPIPLPCNNYPLIFAPEQNPNANALIKSSYPLHAVPIPDMRANDGLKVTCPILLSQWIKAKGLLEVATSYDNKSANFDFRFFNLIPNSMYTVMALREHDLDPLNTSRPGPLGIPSVFITDNIGSGSYFANMPNPFAQEKTPDRNRIINVVVLFMSTQMSYGGAIGHHGLGGDIHAQLKLPGSSFWEFNTVN